MKNKVLSSRDLLSLLWKELYEFNLIPDSDCYDSGHSLIMLLGFIERGKVVSCIGQSAWRSVLAAYKCKNPERNCIRILGFGYMLTEFLIKPLSLPIKEHKEVASIGALINFIASIFDKYLDEGTNRHFMLSPWLLMKLIMGEEQLVLSLLGTIGPGKMRMMIKLLSAYFSKLDQLPFSTRHTHLYKEIHQTIFRMYEAECETQNRRKYTPNIVSVKRKSVFPFVVMGLPGWLAKSYISREDLWWHLRWLYRFGEFFGWIDDIVDIEEDQVAGNPNMYVIKKERYRDKVVFDEYLAKKIAKQGKRILSEWNSKFENIENIPMVTRNIFAICLVSWLGGLPSPAESS